MVDLADEIYKYLKEYLPSKSSYAPRVTQKNLKQSDKFPLVTVFEDDNANVLADTTFKDKTDKILISINIYAEDKAVGNKVISNANIAKELRDLVDEVMCGKFRMQRTACRRTPNLDENIYRITMNYTRKVITNKKLFI